MSAESYILLVDDEPHNLLLLEELLSIEGYRTRSAASGTEALRILCEETPCLILLDVMMPGMDGFELCQQLRDDAGAIASKYPHLQTVPIIFLTALNDDESRLKGLDVMGDDYITKPINQALMLRKISSLLKLSQLREDSHKVALALQAEALQRAQTHFKQQMMSAWEISEALSEKFRLFVPEQFLARIAPQGVESIALGNATETEVTILFCDIRDFTAIAESQTARDTFTWLNAFFTTLNQIITESSGFIDKYLGDAVMAVFDRPCHHPSDGINAAAKICEAMQTFSQTSPAVESASTVRVGIGVHTGQAVIGTIGASQRMDPTVVGDVVNTASRLEELTKEYDCQAIISEAVINCLPEQHPFQIHWLDQVAPRGKQEQLNLYSLTGYQTQAESCSVDPCISST